MVNVGLSWSSMVGIALAVSGAGLYFLRTLRPGLARDHDIFFAAVALLCGGILFFQGWRQDPILQFGQFMLAASTIWFAFEAIRLRGVATEQAKRTTPVVDNERPVSRVYRAELDDYNALDEQRPISRRIRGTRDARSPQADDFSDDRRRSSSTRSLSDRSSSSDRSSASERPSRRRSSGSGSSRPRPIDPPERSFWDDDVEAPPSRTSYSSRSSSRPSGSGSSRPRRSRPSDVERPRRVEEPSSDYVDYQPIDYSDSSVDNSRDFD